MDEDSYLDTYWETQHDPYADAEPYDFGDYDDGPEEDPDPDPFDEDFEDDGAGEREAENRALQAAEDRLDRTGGCYWEE